MMRRVEVPEWVMSGGGCRWVLVIGMAQRMFTFVQSHDKETPCRVPGSGKRVGVSQDRSDLMATFPTKRTPILKTHYTPRNLCMVAGVFVPPSNAQQTKSTA